MNQQQKSFCGRHHQKYDNKCLHMSSINAIIHSSRVMFNSISVIIHSFRVIFNSRKKDIITAASITL
jgi:hypothetical protein